MRKYVDCLAGHERHDTRIADSDVGPLVVYDTDKYHEPDYCTGDDDVSRTILTTGGWAVTETPVIRSILEAGDRSKLVLDFGAHIGYYSIMAAQLGYQVIAFDSNLENIELLKRNAELAGVRGMIDIRPGFVDADSAPLRINRSVELMKCDLEGNDAYAVQMCEAKFKYKEIRYAFIEVSPVFNNSYPAMVNRLLGYGYTATEDGQPFSGDWNFPQTNLLFEATP